jgi:hypothetical protein
MTTLEAAEYIGCSKSQVTNLIRSGKLKATKVKVSFNKYGFVLAIKKSDAKKIRDLEQTVGYPRGRSRK